MTVQLVQYVGSVRWFSTLVQYVGSVRLFTKQMTSCEYCKQLFFNKSSLTRHINKGRCDIMALTQDTKQMLDSIKLLKDSNVSDSQIFITLKSKFSGKQLQPIQECVRALKAKQTEKVNTVSSKVDDMMKQLNVSSTHKKLLQEIKDHPELLENEISFVEFYSYYLQQLKLSKDDATAETFLIAETFLSSNISHELFKKKDVCNILHNVAADNETTNEDEPPLKIQRSSTSSSSSSTESLQDDLDLFNWLSKMF